MTLLSPLFPRRPVDVGSRLAPLPTDGSVPFLDGWAWIATPGHTRGHVSFWHEAERILIEEEAGVMPIYWSAQNILVKPNLDRVLAPSFNREFWKWTID